VAWGKFDVGKCAPRTLSTKKDAGALLFYLGLSFTFFGRGLVGKFTSYHVGKRIGDPAQFMWFLAWLPHAVSQKLNPFFCAALWAPDGINLAWTPLMPLGGLIMAPITAILGPAASYNLLCLLLPALAAFSAYLVCRYVTGSWLSSIFGGYLFGFSGYMLYYLWAGDVDLLTVFTIPLAVYVVLRAMRGELSNRALVVCLTALLVVQLGLFIEIFATAMVFAVITILSALAVYSGETRRRLHKLLLPIVISYVIALLIASPYLYYMFVGPLPSGHFWPLFEFSGDLVFFLLPSRASALGSLPLIANLLDRIPDTVYVGFCYIGPVLLAVIVGWGYQHRREPTGRFFICILLIVAILAMGPNLIVAGRRLWPLPGLLLWRLPLIGAALPVRFAIYMALAVAMITALWLSTGTPTSYTKHAVVVLAFLYSMPNLSSVYWNVLNYTPPFFKNDTFRRYLSRDEIVVLVPYGWLSNAMMWQAETGMYFRMAGGYTGPPPAEFERWPAVVALYNGAYLPEPEPQLKAFLAAHQVTAVLVDERAADSADPRERQSYRIVREALGPAPLQAGGMLIYRFAPASLAAWRDLKPLELERRVNEARFAALLQAAANYLQSGADPSRLSSERLERVGLMRRDWVGGPNIRIRNGLWARSLTANNFELGTFGSRDALKALTTRYRPYVLHVSTTPIAVFEDRGGAEQLELLVMTFDRDGIRRAAHDAAVIH